MRDWLIVIGSYVIGSCVIGSYVIGSCVIGSYVIGSTYSSLYLLVLVSQLSHVGFAAFLLSSSLLLAQLSILLQNIDSTSQNIGHVYAGTCLMQVMPLPARQTSLVTAG